MSEVQRGAAAAPPPPEGWALVEDGTRVNPREPLLVLVRRQWVPAQVYTGGGQRGATRTQRAIHVTYPIKDDVPRWRRSASRMSVDKIAVRVRPYEGSAE